MLVFLFLIFFVNLAILAISIYFEGLKGILSYFVVLFKEISLITIAVKFIQFFYSFVFDFIFTETQVILFFLVGTIVFFISHLLRELNIMN